MTCEVFNAVSDVSGEHLVKIWHINDHGFGCWKDNNILLIDFILEKIIVKKSVTWKPAIFVWKIRIVCTSSYHFNSM